MPIEQYTYWSVTINNPDENDYLIMRNPNSKYIREVVWTPEKGAEGTEHIQAWIRLQRNQSMAFVKKLYPRAHIKPTDKDMYNENSHQYAQKNDSTTAGNHHITLNDPLPANDTLLYKVLEKAWESFLNIDENAADMVKHEGVHRDWLKLLSLTKLGTDLVEREMVMERSGLEKIFISPAYEKMKVKYWREIIFRITHNQDARTERNDEGRSQQDSQGSESQGAYNSQDYEDCTSETYEGYSEGSGSDVSQTSD